MKVLTRELDFTEVETPYPDARQFIERGSVDCMSCLPTLHPIDSYSSGQVEGDHYTVIRYTCKGRRVAQMFDDFTGDEDALS